MAYVYAYPGPPFNFLGTFSETQKNTFEAWLNARLSKFSSIQTFYQIRANNLRKTAGVLEQWYQTDNDEVLAPTFKKVEWQPGPNGYFVPTPRNDHIPMITVSAIKKLYKEQLDRQDESVFHMNHLRNLIEKTEDLAQYANDAITQTPQLIQQIESYFTQPQYQAVLVKDISDQYAGQPRFRVNPLDAPTEWELEQHNRATPGAPIVKFIDQVLS
jgi:uncharacterized phage infection (PIP) family protein YhgE